MAKGILILEFGVQEHNNNRQGDAKKRRELVPL